MQHSDARELKERRGDKPCEHPEYTKEYYLASQTGDYVCTTCGDPIDRNDYLKLMQSREEAKLSKD